MESVLEPHLALLERQAESRSGASAAERAGALEDVVSLHTAVYQVMERHLGEQGLTEAHRPLVPLFRRWLHAARGIVAAARDLRTEGQEVGGLDDLLRAMNRAKPAAEDFDYILGLNQRVGRAGEAATYRPLAEVVDELRSKPRPPG